MRNEDENILMPIHAYPVMNDVVFPKVIDFGLCGVNTTHVREVKLRCKARSSITLVPIRPRRRGERRSLRTFSPGASLRPGSLAFNPDTPRRLSTPPLTPFNSTPISSLVWTLDPKAPLAFEYELAPESASPTFDVEPRRGVVPANGEVVVRVTFRPTTRTTSVMNLRVDLSQFNFEAFVCVVRGTGFPSVTRDEGLAETFGFGASHTLVSIRPRRRGERRSLRTFPGVSLRSGSLGFNIRPRRLSTPLLTPFNSTPTSLRTERTSGDDASLYDATGRPTRTTRALVGGETTTSMKSRHSHLYGRTTRTFDGGAIADGDLSFPPGGSPFGPRGAGGAATASKSRSATVAALTASYNADTGVDRIMGGGGRNMTEIEFAMAPRTGGGAGGGDAYTEYVKVTRAREAEARREAQMRRLMAGQRDADGGLIRTSPTKLMPLPHRAVAARENAENERLDREWTEPKPSAPPPGRGGGGGGADGAVGPRARRLARTLRAEDKKRTGRDFVGDEYEEEHGELEFDGLVLPRRLNGHGAVQHVLSQRRGRLRAKDLRAAVADKRHRDELAEREIEEIEREASDATLGRVAEAMDALPGGGAHGALAALDDPTVDDRVKEILFEREFARVREFERVKEVKTCVAVGDDVLDEMERRDTIRRRDDAENARRTMLANEALAEMSDGRTPWPKAAALGRGASYVVEEERADADADADAESEPTDPEGEPSTSTPTSAATRAPKYDETTNDSWRMRAGIARRFIQAVRRVVFQNRAAKRLAGIRKLIAAFGDKARAAAFVAHEFLAGAGGGPKPDPDVVAVAKMSRLKVYDASFPTYRASNFRTRAPVDIADGTGIKPWEDVELMPLRAPLEWKVKKQYNTFDDAAGKFPALFDHQDVAPVDGVAVIRGAEEEESAPQPRLALDPDGDGAPPALPGSSAAEYDDDADAEDSIAPLAPPIEPIADARVYPEDSDVLAARVACAGEDPLDSAVRPATYAHADSLTRETPAVNAIAALRAVPTLSDVWRPRRDAWRPPAEPPALMEAPAAEDMMEDALAEGTGGHFGGVEIPLVAPDGLPTPARVAKEFYLPRAEEERERAAARAAEGGGGGEEEASAAAAAADDDDDDDAPPLMPRLAKEKELEEETKKRRRELMSRMRERAIEENARIIDPKLRWEL